MDKEKKGWESCSLWQVGKVVGALKVESGVQR